jgi:hypothetical protein
VYDGSVYQTLWDKAQTGPLNQIEVVPGYKVGFFGLVCGFGSLMEFWIQEYIKPILARGQRLAKL